MGFTCVARPEREETRRRKTLQEDVQFRPPSLRDIPDHRTRRRRSGSNGAGRDALNKRGSCCAAPPSRKGAGALPVVTIQDEWEVWDELMRAVDEAQSVVGLKQGAVRIDAACAQAEAREPERGEPEKGRFWRLVPAIALPSFPSLFAAKKPEADLADEPDAASPRGTEPRIAGQASPERASPSPRDWANQILRVRATELLDAPSCDGSVVQAVARAATSPVDGAAPVLTATVVAPIHVDGNDYGASFLVPPPSRPAPSMQRKPASGARAALVHQLAELGHAAAAASDYEGAAATFTRALAADPDDRVGRNEEMLAALQDAQRMAQAQEEYDLDQAVEASLRDQRIPTELHGPYHTEDDNGLCCSPGTSCSAADSAEGWDWGSLDSSSLGDRSVDIDDISDEDVVVPDSTHGLFSANESDSEEQLSAEQESASGGWEGPEHVILLPQASALEEELLLPPSRTDASVPGCGCAGIAGTALVTSTAGRVLPDPRDAFETPKLNFSFLTTHEVLDLNEWRNLHDENTWHEFSGDIRDRRGGAYPDEWFDVVRARKERLECLRNAQEQDKSEGKATCTERRRAEVPRPRLRPGCVPWEPLAGDEGSDTNCVATQAHSAVRRCAFEIPPEDSLVALPSINDTRNNDSNVAEDEIGRHERQQGDRHCHRTREGKSQRPEGRANSTREELSGGALIWHPQPLTVARKVSSA